jgi:hypothetical protein
MSHNDGGTDRCHKMTRGGEGGQKLAKKVSRIIRMAPNEKLKLIENLNSFSFFAFRSRLSV